MDRLLQKIRRKAGGIDLVEALTHQVTGSELQSLLLEVYRNRSRQISAAELLRNYQKNRFARPASGDPILIKELELELLKLFAEGGFTPVEFGPLAPYGTSSALAPVDQNNVVTALRGTEVVSDVTNLLALEVATQKKHQRRRELRLCANHRLVRAQKFDIPGFTPHFRILSLVTAGRNRGGFDFETEAILQQIRLHREVLLRQFNVSPDQLELLFTFFPERNRDSLQKVFDHIASASELSSGISEWVEKEDFTYYQSIRFKIILYLNGKAHQVVDGGLVDWTQQLLQDKKERLVISGIGTEYLLKIPHL